LHFLGLLWWNRDFSKGYGAKNKKISPLANSRPRLSRGNVSWLLRALLHALPVAADALPGLKVLISRNPNTISRNRKVFVDASPLRGGSSKHFNRLNEKAA
jgi:hypothetical protein